jgi:predicted RNase H-like nuclease (RuvC/YqgF family)
VCGDERADGPITLIVATTRRDSPEFWERAADVCGLYLAQPDNAVVLSIDEKTGIQAKSRKHPAHSIEERGH